MASTTVPGKAGVEEEIPVISEPGEPPGKDTPGGLETSSAGSRPKRVDR